MGEVVPFPTNRRRALISRIAARMAAVDPGKAEKHLARQLSLQAHTMRRKGIAEHLIVGELQSLEGAARAALVRLSFTSGGAQ